MKIYTPFIYAPSLCDIMFLSPVHQCPTICSTNDMATWERIKSRTLSSGWMLRVNVIAYLTSVPWSHEIWKLETISPDITQEYFVELTKLRLRHNRSSDFIGWFHSSRSARVSPWPDVRRVHSPYLKYFGKRHLANLQWLFDFDGPVWIVPTKANSQIGRLPNSAVLLYND